jgi:hypothetical protein
LLSRHLSSFVLTSLFAVAVLGSPARATRQDAVVDTARLGPQIGSPAPPFSGTDQVGRIQTLETSRGPKGTMLVFFRSADW